MVVHEKIIAEFRKNSGRMSGQFTGVSLLVLTTTGRRSAEPKVGGRI